MKQNNKLIFYSRYRKKRQRIAIRRHRSCCEKNVDDVGDLAGDLLDDIGGKAGETAGDFGALAGDLLDDIGGNAGETAGDVDGIAEDVLRGQGRLGELCVTVLYPTFCLKLRSRFPFLSHHITIYLHKSSIEPELLGFGITVQQRSAVNCWTQHVNKYVQLSSSASGRNHTDRELCWGKLFVCVFV